MRKLLLILAVLQFAGCATLGPTTVDGTMVITSRNGTRYFIEDRERFNPPIWYSDEYDIALECVAEVLRNGIRPGRIVNSDFRQLRWFKASAITTNTDVDPAAMHERLQHRITIEEEYLGDWRVVRHESLHEILGRSATHGQGAFFTCDPFMSDMDDA